MKQQDANRQLEKFLKERNYPQAKAMLDQGADPGLLKNYSSEINDIKHPVPRFSGDPSKKHFTHIFFGATHDQLGLNLNCGSPSSKLKNDTYKSLNDYYFLEGKPFVEILDAQSERRYEAVCSIKEFMNKESEINHKILNDNIDLLEGKLLYILRGLPNIGPITLKNLSKEWDINPELANAKSEIKNFINFPFQKFLDKFEDKDFVPTQEEMQDKQDIELFLSGNGLYPYSNTYFSEPGSYLRETLESDSGSSLLAQSMFESKDVYDIVSNLFNSDNLPLYFHNSLTLHIEHYNKIVEEYDAKQSSDNSNNSLEP